MCPSLSQHLRERPGAVSLLSFPVAVSKGRSCISVTEGCWAVGTAPDLLFTVAQYVGLEELKGPVTEPKLDSLAEMSCEGLSNPRVSEFGDSSLHWAESSKFKNSSVHI